MEAASHIHAEERCASVPNKKFEYDVFSGVLRGRVPFQRKHGFVLPFQAILREPVENSRRWEGTLGSCADGLISLEVAEGKTIQFPFDQVEKANLKFEWGTRAN